MEMRTNLQIAREYLAALESGVDRATLAAFFTEDVVQEVFPSGGDPWHSR